MDLMAIMMGNSTSAQRNFLYWGAVLLLMIPPSVNGWNIPFFGGGASGPAISNSPADDPGLRFVDGNPTPTGADNLNGPSATISGMSTVAAPMMYGPQDAPHLRQLPSYFSNQIPPRVKQLVPSVLSALRSARVKLFHLLWYKPPVGIVGAWSFMRVMEKVYGLFSPPPPTSGEEALADAEGRLSGAMKSLLPGKASSILSPWGSIGKMYTANVQNQQMRRRRRKRKRKVRKGRSFDLDRGDRSYDNFGGVETVRVRACQEGLRSALAVASTEVEPSSSDGSGETKTKRRPSGLFGARNVDKAYDASRDESMAEYKEDVEAALGALQLSCPPRGSREYFVEQSAEALSALGKYIALSQNDDSGKESQSSIDEQNVRLLLKHSSKLVELRTLDALMRTLRDRHLLVAARLRRTQDYWKWHVNLSGGRIGRSVLSLRQKLMKVFPWMGSWMGYDFRDRNQREYELATSTLERELVWLGKVERLLLERPEEMEAGDLLSVMGENSQNDAHWWNSFVKSGVENSAESAPSMEASIQFLVRSKNRMWLRQSEQWCEMARNIIKDALEETISSTFTEVKAESHFLKQWAAYDDDASNTNSWLAVLSLVDYAASPRRAGERRHFELSRLTRYDFLGIPSSCLLLASANSLHDNIIAPHKQEIVDFAKGTFSALYGVAEFRFYTPLKDIVLDLLNRRPRMVDQFALMNEQTSLDNMLMDLGVGDGTPQTRASALAGASRMYEQEVAHGAIRGIVRGKVAQLMLIQIQQLKTDLLQAMDTIDSLVDANRLNVQLVASIPAALIIFFGTRALFLFWSNIRMQDFRLPRDVHAEMSDTLKKVEECLVLSNYQLDTSMPMTSVEDRDSRPAMAETCLRPKEMGQMLLLLHSYLNLLDYMSPPFPSKQCDSIQQSVQNLLMQGQMSTTRQLELLKVIQSKHSDLLKSI